mmetsp:Transcript_28907/g.58209  ORF Transcript_28907/g.58209 Transcript_28907/m.58209 type:complete len:401 (-) Transcript_28907:900-2102(-)
MAFTRCELEAVSYVPAAGDVARQPCLIRAGCDGFEELVDVGDLLAHLLVHARVVGLGLLGVDELVQVEDVLLVVPQLLLQRLQRPCGLGGGEGLLLLVVLEGHVLDLLLEGLAARVELLAARLHLVAEGVGVGLELADVAKGLELLLHLLAALVERVELDADLGVEVVDLLQLHVPHLLLLLQPLRRCLRVLQPPLLLRHLCLQVVEALAGRQLRLLPEVLGDVLQQLHHAELRLLHRRRLPPERLLEVVDELRHLLILLLQLLVLLHVLRHRAPALQLLDLVVGVPDPLLRVLDVALVDGDVLVVLLHLLQQLLPLLCLAQHRLVHLLLQLRLPLLQLQPLLLQHVEPLLQRLRLERLLPRRHLPAQVVVGALLLLHVRHQPAVVVLQLRVLHPLLVPQ